MEKPLQYEVHEKETIYFVIKVLIAVFGYIVLGLFAYMLINNPRSAAFIPLLFYIVIFIVYLFFKLGIMIGYIKGNAIKVTRDQFPELYSVLLKQCERLEISNIPDLYIMQSGGVLNAFAASFWGSHYVVIYSEIAEEAFQNNKETVEFIIGHELGHIKRKHMLKSLLLFPSFMLPFLNSAYSRACEYTCDNIGSALNANGARPGLILLASGKNIWKKVNVEKFIEQENTEGGFWFWFAEKVSTHPRLTKRLRNIQPVQPASKTVLQQPAPVNIIKESDHSTYLPK